MQKKEKTGLSIDPCLVNPQYKNVSFIFYQLFCRCVVKSYLGSFGDGNSSFYNDLSIFCKRFGSVSFAAAFDQTSHIIECLKDKQNIIHQAKFDQVNVLQKILTRKPSLLVPSRAGSL